MMKINSGGFGGVETRRVDDFLVRKFAAAQYSRMNKLFHMPHRSTNTGSLHIPPVNMCTRLVRHDRYQPSRCRSGVLVATVLAVSTPDSLLILLPLLLLALTRESSGIIKKLESVSP